jgi:hypothetical protein
METLQFRLWIEADLLIEADLWIDPGFWIYSDYYLISSNPYVEIYDQTDLKTVGLGKILYILYYKLFSQSWDAFYFCSCSARMETLQFQN